MATIRAQVVLPYVSNKPEDVAVNTWHFSSASAGEAAYDVIRDHLVEFYNASHPANSALCASLSNALNRTANAAKIKFYDLADAKPRPVSERLWTLGPPSSSTLAELPAEVAVVGSFYALRNLPRYRGRLFFGPFHSGVLLDATNERSRPSASLVETIRLSFARLIGKAANTQNLAVYSRVDNVARIATAGWVDDAWDTQRRRGQEPLSRSVF